MSGGRKITPEVFSVIKKLVDDGKKKRDISITFDVDPSTVYRISNSATFEEYMERKPKAAKPKPQPAIGEISVSDGFKEIRRQLEKQTVLLERMIELWKN